ncbi:hypothetical protein JCM3774_000542 [Rhodotorula dairenensis]
MRARDRSPPYPGPPSYRTRPSPPPERYDPRRPTSASASQESLSSYRDPYYSYRDPASSYRAYAPPALRDVDYRPPTLPPSGYTELRSYPWTYPAPRPSPAAVSSSSSTPATWAPRSTHRPRSPSPCTADQLRDQRAYRPPTANMSTDYQAYLETTADLAHMTVDRLKRAIRGINQALATGMRLSGKKNDYYTALLDTLAIEYDKPDKTRFYTCRRYISEAKHSSNPNGPTWSLPASSASTGYNGYGQSQASTWNSGYGGASTSGYHPGTGYPPYNTGLPAPRFVGGHSQAAAATASGASASGSGSWQQNARADEPPIRFRPSPFYRIEKSLSNVAPLIRAGPGDRKVATIKFTLTPAQLELLRKSKEAKTNPQYQVRLYCTSDTNYNQVRPQATQFPAPIEFPAACEVKLNGSLVPANTKGIKKQPGTAPPVNLSGAKGPAVPTTTGTTITVDLVYTNTEKVYYIVAYLVEYTPIDKIVARVQAGKFRTKEEVIQGIIKLNDDPDVEASAFGLSLKDPLSYARIETPIRSVHCQHIACFDAVTWFEMNEQTPQWMCPICSKTLKVEDMLVDGYFEDILKVCSSAVDSVTVEPDGTWRSDNNKFGTAKPRVVSASASTSVRNSPAPSASSGDRKPFSGSGNGTAAREAVTLELDSDDDDDEDDESAQPLAKRPRLNGHASFRANGGGSLTPAGGRIGTGTPLSATNDVLDLTLSSDDDDDTGAPPPRPAAAAAPMTAPGPPRPSIAMARTGSSEQKKGLEDVQRDIAAMNERMRRDYGENWRDHFGIHGHPEQPNPNNNTGLPSPGPNS